jgi:hypothetical protein
MWLIKQILEAPMTPLQEHLYQYIMEDRFTVLLADEAYQTVRQQVSDAESQLLAALPEEQKHLFIQYTDTENNAFSLQLRHVFQEALLIAHDILRLSL